MIKRFKKIAHPALKLWHKIYYLSPRKYSYKGVTTIVHKEVFSPYLTISTNIFVDFIDNLDLKNHKVLELGCGNGLISLFAAKKGAFVTASDINQTALTYLNKSAALNQVTINLYYSDLFNDLPKDAYDYILINPPYYPKNPINIKEQAWFCGADFEYFKQLFQQLPTQLTNSNKCYMILSDACQLETINTLAKNENLLMQKVFTKKVTGEENYIFEISKG